MSSYLLKASSKPRVFSRKQILTNESKPGITSLIDNKKKVKKFDLTDNEKKIYGNRCPSGYTKQKVLGRGGCAIVWLAEKDNGPVYAIKQFPKKQSSVSSSQVEIEIFETLNCEALSDHKGHEYISHLVEKIDEKKDVWLVYELGGNALSKMLFEVKGEFHNGERIYFINHQHFYSDLK